VTSHNSDATGRPRLEKPLSHKYTLETLGFFSIPLSGHGFVGAYVGKPLFFGYKLWGEHSL